METLIGILPWIQITLAVLLTVIILIQQRGAGAGGVFGGSADGTIHFERRGLEKSIFKFTIVLAIIFILSVLAQTFVDNENNNYDELPITEITDIDASTSTTDGGLINTEANTNQAVPTSDLIDFEILNQDSAEDSDSL